MSGFYGRLQGTASRLMAKYKQGQVAYTINGAPTGPAWNPTPGPPVSYTLDATVQGVEADYVDGSLILATDKQVTCAVFGAEPSLAGTITIDGKVCQIVRVDKVPGAGVTIAWRIFVRA
jgi:hypothetical protein